MSQQYPCFIRVQSVAPNPEPGLGQRPSWRDLCRRLPEFAENENEPGEIYTLYDQGNLFRDQMALLVLSGLSCNPV